MSESIQVTEAERLQLKCLLLEQRNLQLQSLLKEKDCLLEANVILTKYKPDAEGWVFDGEQGTFSPPPPGQPVKKGRRGNRKSRAT